MFMSIIALIGGALCGVLKCVLGKYIFSPCATFLCALAVGASDNPLKKVALIAGLLVSIIGDWFLNHNKDGSGRFLYGVMGFFAAHCLFAWYALTRFKFSPAPLVIAGILVVFYAIYLAVRMLPHTESGLKIPISMYAFISILSLYFAMSMNAPVAEKAIYIAGIALIFFSDTMIGEGDFLHNAFARKLVLPTYYACHVLIALSAIVR